jgi:hypothetical protein
VFLFYGGGFMDRLKYSSSPDVAKSTLNEMNRIPTYYCAKCLTILKYPACHVCNGEEIRGIEINLQC